MDYKQTIYRSYQSIHYTNIYEPKTILNIESHFPSWDYYFQNILPTEKDAKIVDLGCGDGNFVYYLSKRGFENVIGVDVSTELIEHGRSMGIDNLFEEDLNSFLMKRKASVDVFVIRDVLEHFEPSQVMLILTEVYNCLLPGGYIIIQVPNGEGLYFPSVYFGDFTHSCAFSKSSLMQIGRACNFSKIECYQMEPPPINFFGWVRNVFWKYRILKHRFWKFVATGYSKGIFTENIICTIYK